MAIELGLDQYSLYIYDVIVQQSLKHYTIRAVHRQELQKLTEKLKHELKFAQDLGLIWD